MLLNIVRSFGSRYAFVVAGVVFVSLMAAAGLRSTPGVLLIPLEKAFGWSRGEISFAAAVGIFLYGLVGPFAAALMQRFGIKRTLATALLIMAASSFASTLMTQSWPLVLAWGVISGLATGSVPAVRGA